MKHVSLLEFRKHAQRIMEKAGRGEGMIVTFRGKPVCRLEPIRDKVPDADDAFYRLDQLADTKVRSINNVKMDKIIYGL